MSAVSSGHGAVGRERVMAPVGEQLGLGADEPGAADDQPEVAELCFGDLRFPGVRVVGDRDPVGLGDLGDQRPDRLGLLDADRELDPCRRARSRISLRFSNPESARMTIGPECPARRTRAISSSTNRRNPRCVFAAPLRLRMWSTSPVSERTARIG